MKRTEKITRKHCITKQTKGNIVDAILIGEKIDISQLNGPNVRVTD
jgi:hypothetical protein